MPSLAIPAFKTRHMVRNNYSITRVEVIYTIANLNNFTRCFVSENQRNTVSAIPFHQIASANTTGQDFY
jgi:hypothetical protein